MSLKLSDKELDQLEKMYSIALPVKDCAAILGTNRSALEKLIKTNDNVRQRVEKARGEANFKITETMFYLATEQKDIKALIYWTKCRMNWSELGVPENVDEDPYPQVSNG